MFINAYSILKPLYEAASKSGLSPTGYLKFQQNLDRVAGALKLMKSANISMKLRQSVNQEQLRTIKMS